MAAPKLAIDFGTSRTKVAYYDESAGKSQLVELGEEIRTVLPSIFYIPKEGQGERLVGDEAKKMVDRDPEGIVLSLKKEIHKMGKKRCGPDRPAIDRIQLAADLFRYIHKRCRTEVFHDEDLFSCRLTVPSDFKAQQREAIRRAAQLGGFREVAIVEEPMAAAQAWLWDHAGEKFGNNVVVCDVGGGTTDFAFLKFTDGRFEADEKVLSDGFQQGGNDVDELILEKLWENNSANEEMQGFRAGFLLKICQGRELISRTKKSETLILVNGYQCVLSRSVTEEATAQFVELVKAGTQRFLERIRNQVKTENAPILLVGGASKLPGLSDALSSLNAGKVFLWSESDYATVKGAVEIPAIRTTKPIIHDKTSLLTDAVKISPSVDFEIINTMIGDGRSDEAFEMVSQSIMTNPNPDLFALWIECAITVADANKVLAMAREIHKRRNKDLLGACCLTNAMIDVGRKNEAKDLISLFITNEHSAPHELLWTRYYLNPEAILLEELQKITPNSPRLLAEQAAWVLLRGENSGAGEIGGRCLGSALKLNPNCFIALFVKLFAELEFGFFTTQSEFEDDLRRIKRISPNNFFTRYISGLYLLTLGDFCTAITVFDQAISDPRSQGADSLLGLIYLYKSRCYLELKDFNSARTSVENCLRIIPNNVIALGIRGDLFLGEKRFEDAFKDYTQGLLGSPEYMVCLMGRAYCLAATSQFDEAAKCYEAAWRIDFSNQEAKESAVYCTISMIMNRPATLARNAYLRPNIPESKLNLAFQTYLSPRGLRDATKVLLLFDDTFFGSGEDGFCLTADEMYWHNAYDANCNSVYYSAIIKSAVSAGNDLLVNGNKVGCAFGGGADLWMRIIDALTQLHARIKSVQTATNLVTG